MHRIHNTKTTFEAYDAQLIDTKIRDVNMDRASFHDVAIERGVFHNVNATGMEFRDVNFTAASFEDCDFTGATIGGVLVEDLITAYQSLRRPADTPQSPS